MVKLLIGRKGTGKTAKMVEIANDCLREVNGSVVFINKNQRLMYDLKYRIRVVCMEEYEVGDIIITLPCFHIYHKQCIKKWINAKK